MRKIGFRLLTIVKARWGLYTFGLFASTLVGTFRQILLAWILKILFDTALEGNFYKLLWAIVINLGIMAVFSAVRPTLTYLQKKAVLESVGDFKKKLFAKILNLPVNYFNHEHSGVIISKLNNDLKEVENALALHYTSIVNYIMLAVGMVIAMFYLHYWLAVVALTTAFVALMFNFLFAGPLKAASRRVQQKLGTLTGTLADLLSGVKVIKAFNLYVRMVGKFEARNDQVYRASIRRVQVNASLCALNDLGKALDIIGVVGIGAFFAMQGKISVGTIVAIWQLKNPILTIFNQLGDLFTNLHTSFAASTRVFDLYDEQEELNVCSHLKTSNQATEGKAVVMSEVEFGYLPNTRVLYNFALEVKLGEKVAIVGPSGGGKSTIFKLLLGFYPAKKGQIIIDGDSAENTDITKLRAKIAYVPQDAYLFSGTILENIRYGKPEASEEEVVRAAQIANANEFIINFEEGYATLVGERGAQLSGGQRQRISIARAVLKDAPIILLDEATSALDTESEYLVQEALDRLSKGRTILIITHRFSTIKNVDEIKVVAGGQVKECGRHEELMIKENGIYRRLYEQQYQL